MTSNNMCSFVISRNRYYLFIAFLFVISHSFISSAKTIQYDSSITAASLFTIMETKAEDINSIVVDVSLSENTASTAVELIIKSPDKFAIIFNDNSAGVYFNGSSLWFYISKINEAFYYFGDSKTSYLSYLPMLSPKKLFTALTKRTLFSLFNVKLTNTKLISSNKKTGKKLVYYTLKFTPKMKTAFKQIFSIGYYFMVLSNKTYLPVEASEYSPTGAKRGHLIVKKYSINEKIDDKIFNFSPPEGTILTPISVILARKIEEYSGLLTKKISSYANKLKNKVMNWSF